MRRELKKSHTNRNMNHFIKQIHLCVNDLRYEKIYPNKIYEEKYIQLLNVL
jgi:hypothetical protein